MTERESLRNDARLEDAKALWRLENQARDEARVLREQAAAIDREADKLSALASAVTDGRDLAEALGV